MKFLIASALALFLCMPAMATPLRDTLAVKAEISTAIAKSESAMTMNMMFRNFKAIRIAQTALYSQAAHAEDAQLPAITDAPQSVEQAAAFLPTLILLAKNGQWLLFGALLTLVLVFLIRQYVLPSFGLKNPKLLPLVSVILGMLVGVGVAVLGGAKPEAALLASLSGPLASSLWGAVVKYFIPA